MKKFYLILFTVITFCLTLNLNAALENAPAVQEFDPSTPLDNYISLGEWNTDGDFEHWICNADVTNCAVYGGSITGVVAGADEQLYLNLPSTGFSINLISGSVVEIRCKYSPNTSNFWGQWYINNGSEWKWRLSFITNNFEQPKDGQFHVYRATFTADLGYVNIFRLDQYTDIPEVIGDTFEVDYVRFANAVETIKVDSQQLYNYSSLAEWNVEGDIENWGYINVENVDTTNGFLYGTATSADPHFYKTGADGLPEVNLTENTIIEFRLKQTAAYTSDMELFYGTTDNPGFASGRHIVIPKELIPADGNFHTYQCDMSALAEWDSKLDAIRIDPYVGSGASGVVFEVDYVRLGNREMPTANPSATQGEFQDKIVVEWEPVNFAGKYQVWRSITNDSSSAITNSPEIFTNVYEDFSAEPDTYYYYWVKTFITNDWGNFGSSALGFTKAATKPDTPVNLSPTSFNVVTAPVELVATEYHDAGGYPCLASQWQLSSDESFSSVTWDSKETIPINIFTLPANASSLITNYWRVRYKKEFNTWSEWSTPTSFILIQKTQQSVIFWDSFNAAGSGNVNHNYAKSGRQFGNAAPLTYTIQDSTVVGCDSANPGMLQLGINSAISPNYSFTDSGNFKIEFDVIPHDLNKTNEWVALCFGKSDQTGLFPVSPSGAGLVFFCSKGFQAFDGENLVGSSNTGVPNDEPLHIVLTASTTEFENEPLQYAVFANGTPMKVDSAKSGYIYNDSSGFNNNYISLFSYNYATTNKSIFDNLKISKTENSVSATNWLNDADMLPINPAKVTHAVNINGPSVTINGVDFIGTGTNFGAHANGSSILSSNGWELMSSGGVVSFHNVGDVTNLVTGNSKTLMEFFAYFNNAGALKLSNLSPFSTNVISLYSYGWGNPGDGRFIFFSTSSGGSITNIDQDSFGKGTGIIIRQTYVADKYGKCTVVFSPVIIAGFHLAGFLNEEISAPQAKIYAPEKLDFGEVLVGNSATLQLEIMNIGADNVSGSIGSVTAPFSLANNSYFATSATSDILNVIFSPTSEGIFSENISLSGNGGNANVILTGTAVPEPVFLCLILFSLLLRRK